MRKLTVGIYSVPHCSVYFKVIKVQYDDGIIVKLKGCFVNKNLTGEFETKNYKLIYKRISHWEKIYNRASHESV